MALNNRWGGSQPCLVLCDWQCHPAPPWSVELILRSDSYFYFSGLIRAFLFSFKSQVSIEVYWTLVSVSIALIILLGFFSPFDQGMCGATLVGFKTSHCPALPEAKLISHNVFILTPCWIQFADTLFRIFSICVQ